MNANMEATGEMLAERVGSIERQKQTTISNHYCLIDCWVSIITTTE